MKILYYDDYEVVQQIPFHVTIYSVKDKTQKFDIFLGKDIKITNELMSEIYDFFKKIRIKQK